MVVEGGCMYPSLYKIIAIVLTILFVVQLILAYTANAETITTYMYIQPNDIIAPHLYDFFVDSNGATSIGPLLIDIPDDKQYTWGVRVRMVDSTYDYAVFMMFSSVSGYHVPLLFAYDEPTWNPNLYDTYNAGVYNGSVGKWSGWPYIRGNSTWHKVQGTWNGTHICILVDDYSKCNDVSSPGFNNMNLTHARIFLSTFKGYISYAFIIENVTFRTIGNKLADAILLIDPTFWNGTHVFDIVNDYAIKVYTSVVSRVNASEKWLWLVKNATNDNLVHFKWFPLDAKIIVEYKPGLVQVYNVTSPDIALNLSKGYYMVSWDDTENVLRLYYINETPTLSDVSQLFSWNNMVNWYVAFWGPAAFAIVFLVPISAYLKTKSLTIFSSLLALLGSASVIALPEELKPVGFLGLAVGLAGLVYRVYSGRE